MPLTAAALNNARTVTAEHLEHAVVFDSQYFAQIRRYYDALSERRDTERSCQDGQLDLFDGHDVAV